MVPPLSSISTFRYGHIADAPDALAGGRNGA
jgi:hypothetical protein